MKIAQISQFNQQNYSTHSKNKQQAFGIYFKMDTDVVKDTIDTAEQLSKGKGLSYITRAQNAIKQIYAAIISHNLDPKNHKLFDDVVPIKRVMFKPNALGYDYFAEYMLCTDSHSISMQSDDFYLIKGIDSNNKVVGKLAKLQDSIVEDRLEKYSAVDYLAKRADKTLPGK